MLWQQHFDVDPSLPAAERTIRDPLRVVLDVQPVRRRLSSEDQVPVFANPIGQVMPVGPWVQ
jgi:hypothetical protein